jgi:hypothetical protein
MAKAICCRHVDVNCDFTGSGESTEEVLQSKPKKLSAWM